MEILGFFMWWFGVFLSDEVVFGEFDELLMVEIIFKGGCLIWGCEEILGFFIEFKCELFGDWFMDVFILILVE